MDFFVDPPADQQWERVQDREEYTKANLVRRLNYISCLQDMTAKPLAYDSVTRWGQTASIWSSLTAVIANLNVKKKYIRAVLEESVDEGVVYLEARKSFNDRERLYVLDPDPKYKATHGKRYLEEVAGSTEIAVVQEVVDEFKRSHPEFVGYRRLIQSVRAFDQAAVTQDITRGIALQKEFPAQLAGFDLAGEEDVGFSGFYHWPGYKIWKDAMEDQPGMHLVAHAGETSQAGMMTLPNAANKGDMVGPGDNLYHAFALDVSRIGHGLAIAKHPGLMEKARDKPMPVEVCCVCNHLLGFVPDFRNHPAVTLYRYGVPITLASDAQGAFGFEHFTVDWYMAFLAWELKLSDMKYFAYSSLKYSTLNELEKKEAICKWNTQWVECMKKLHSKARSHIMELAPRSAEVLRLFPDEVHAQRSEVSCIPVQIFGRNFESGICTPVLYRYGKQNHEEAAYINATRLVCPFKIDKDAGISSKEITKPELFLSFDGGKNFLPSGHYITVSSA